MDRQGKAYVVLTQVSISPLASHHNSTPLEWVETGAWPQSKRSPGLANSWQGAAWVVFKRERAGHPIPDRIGEKIARRLNSEMTLPVPRGYCGFFIGCAAEPLLAAYAARLGLVEIALVRRSWTRLSDIFRHSRQWDLNLGAAGALLACSEIEEVLPGIVPRALAKRLAARVLMAMDLLFRPGTAGWFTGMAHGLAGAMLAIESGVSRRYVQLQHKACQRYIDALVGAATSTRNGELFWPQVSGATEFGMQSWCHGTPGVVLALLALHRLTGEAAYIELALSGLAGMELLVDGATSPTLCCGRTGFGHIFLEGFRLTGERRWLHAARQAAQTISPQFRPHQLSLYKGTLGVAYLEQRLAEPFAYPMPGLGALSAE